MSLVSALTIAGSGLETINQQFSLISHNVANASTPGYAVESASLESVTAAGQGSGVIAEPAQRAVDQALQANLLQQNAASSGLQTTSAALSAIAATQGTPGKGQDLASLLGAMQDSFSTLLNDPSSMPQQQATIQSASNLASGIGQLASAIGQQRQDAQDAIVSGITSVNKDLATIGDLSKQIMAARAQGQSSADLENQRDVAISNLSQYVAVTVLPQTNGDMTVATASGVELPIHDGSSPILMSSAAIGPTAYYPGGGIQGILLGGADITSSLSGGQIAANVNLRDKTLPTYQGELDEFAQNLSAAFSGKGLPLFTNPSGAVPASAKAPPQSGYVGYASAIQVNPALAANPSAVRDGLPSQNSSSIAGFNGVIKAVLTSVLGTAPISGVALTGLGPAGALNASFGQPASFADFAATLVAGQAKDSSNAASQLSTQQALQSTLQSKLNSETGVDMDTEMSGMIALQNAYGANAKIIGAVQTMFNDVLGMVGLP